MEILIWVGGALSVLGMIGLVYCVVRVVRAKRGNLTDEELHAVLKSVLPWNMGALGLSALGLMLVVVGLFLS